MYGTSQLSVLHHCPHLPGVRTSEWRVGSAWYRPTRGCIWRGGVWGLVFEGAVLRYRCGGVDGIVVGLQVCRFSCGGVSV